MNGCEDRRGGGKGEFISTQGNSSHSVCASARYRHRAREFAFFAPRSLRFSSAPRKHIPPFDSFTALARRVAPALHRLRTSISVWEKGLVTPFSFPPPLSPSPLLPQSSEGSLSPRYNATPSNPIHRCFSHPHIALLDQSTTSYWLRAPHCVSKESHICSSLYNETMFLISC